MVAILKEQIGDLLYIDSVIEWSGITNLSFIGRHFALQTLN